MRKICLFLFLFSISILVQAQSKKQQKCINAFKKDIMGYVDSCNVCFDNGLNMLDKGMSPQEVSDQIRDKVLYFEKMIDARLILFNQEADEVELPQKHYIDTIKAMEIYTRSGRDKYDRLTDSGVVLN